MPWTKEQQLAIDKDKTNIIVSAGAGSGKTAVLTERVIRKLKQKIDINKLLVLTFTKEAANEMKVRIRNSILKNEELSPQLEYLEQAYITTFDSFSLSIVKKYHYLLNIKKDINIIDSNFINIKKKEILENIFNNYYLNIDENFSKLINDFCTKDDEQLKKEILNISNNLDLKINKEEYLNNYINNFYNDNYINSIIEKYQNLITTKIQSLKEILNEIYLIDNDYYNKIEPVINILLNSKTYEEQKNNINFELPRLKNSEEELKILKEELSNTKKEIKELLVYENKDKIKEYILSTKPYTIAIINIINKLDKEIIIFKNKYDIYEFTDVAKMAIKVVKENTNIKKELKEYYNEIMVDEYQDTSDLQEEFISLISNNNVYMVGDIKQSIYRFRNANPTIFKEKYEKYSNLDNGIKIDLLKNFRSREEVLNGINDIFNLVMDLSIGGADYKKTHQMIFGNNIYLNEGKTSFNNNLEIYNYSNEDKTYQKEEKEIFIIANDIKEKIKQKYQVLDKKTSKLRDITYSDFCIIMDRGTEFNKYKKIFEYLSLPLTIYKDENLTEDDITYIFKNILGLIIKTNEKIIDKEFKYFYTSISRSFLLEDTDQYIFDTFINNNFYNTNLFKTIKDIEELIPSLNIKQITELIIDKFNIYKNLIKIGDINNNIMKIDQIIDLSTSLNELGYTIKDFYNYINQMLNDKTPIKYNATSTNTNSIKIMNIHKSKGLEFPICYYSGLHKTFNKSDLKDRFLYSNTYGIITPVFDEGITNNITKILLKEETNKEEISEKIRLFYVALTRAREKMIIVTSLSNEEKEYKDIVNNTTRLKYNSFLDIINSVQFKLTNNIKNIDLDNIYMTKEYKKIKNIDLNIPKNNNDKLKIININIEKEVKEESKYSKENIKLNTKEEINNLKEGLLLHYKLEIDDFYNPKYDITKNLVKHLDLNNCNIYKEYEFIYTKENKESHGIIDLILEYENIIKIIDYKLNDITDELYIKQLNGYKKYIEEKTGKTVNIYLYSIIKNKLIEL